MTTNQYITKEPYKGLVLELLKTKEEPKYIIQEVKQEVNQEVKETKKPKPKENHLIKLHLLKVWKQQLQTNTIQVDNLIKLQKLAIEFGEPTEIILKIGSRIREKGINQTKL